METDASDYTLTAILSIVNENNEVHPVALYSHTFTVVELNYDTHNKEFVKIIDGGLHFYFLFSLYFLFLFFSIFRTTWVRVYQSHCHKLMAKSQD